MRAPVAGSGRTASPTSVPARSATSTLALMICPGSTDTGRWTELVNITAKERGVSVEEATKHLVREVPMGRVVVPEDIAGLTVFLASKQAAMITGTAINVDGGRSPVV